MPKLGDGIGSDFAVRTRYRELSAVSGRIQYAPPVSVTSSLSPMGLETEISCFTAPVRCGRRRHDQVGHLELTTWRLRFHGSADFDVLWARVMRLEFEDRDLVVSLKTDGRRMLRFCFQTHEEAHEAALLVRSFASL
jgi:hypothetical protein